MNSAADFFVRRIEDWRDQLIELHRGTRSTIYRPTLFLLLKIGRLSAVDLDDCISLLHHIAASNESLDRDRNATNSRLSRRADDRALLDRRAALLDAVYSSSEAARS